jgi:hypothetical protein
MLRGHRREQGIVLCQETYDARALMAWKNVGTNILSAKFIRERCEKQFTRRTARLAFG